MDLCSGSLHCSERCCALHALYIDCTTVLHVGSTPKPKVGYGAYSRCLLICTGVHRYCKLMRMRRTYDFQCSGKSAPLGLGRVAHRVSPNHAREAALYR